MLKKLFKKRKKKPFYMNENEDYSSYQIGDHTYGKPKVVEYDETTNLKIGKFCSIADNVTILLGGEHRVDWITTYPFNVTNKKAKKIQGHPATKGDIIIGNDVWIGYGATILSGVTIGDGAVIGTGALITKNVKPYEIVGGNPAKHIKFRFTDEEIDKLLKVKWWNWPIEDIENNFSTLMGDTKEFFKKEYKI